MILGVPTFAVIYYIVNMLINHRLEKKKLPIETEAYGEKSYVDSDGTYIYSHEDEENQARELRKEKESKNTKEKEESKEPEDLNKGTEPDKTKNGKGE